MTKGGINTRQGGHAKAVSARQIIADPNGNREQRRAARRLGVVLAGEHCSLNTATPGCPNCGRASHGFGCTGTLPEGGDAR